ncbi:MAG TPA: hypothetical protein VHL09_11730, partial [Dehalococcoidia bacterium]|nr:hypothetical protein [Dehalococcoidia bacterium]
MAPPAPPRVCSSGLGRRSTWATGPVQSALPRGHLPLVLGGLWLAWALPLMTLGQQSIWWDEAWTWL